VHKYNTIQYLIIIKYIYTWLIAMDNDLNKIDTLRNLGNTKYINVQKYHPRLISRCLFLIWKL